MYKQELLLLRYNKDVICVIDENKTPECNEVMSSRRNTLLNNNLPSYDPYIPRANAIFYNCSTTECATLTLSSLTQVTSPELQLKSCYVQSEKYQCETIRYNNFKNIDKLLFLINNVGNKTFYLVDCLVYSDRGRVCHKKDDVDSHTKLVDTGTIVRPNETNILSQDEFLCEQDDLGLINCDLNSYIPFGDELKPKEVEKVEGDILLKTGNYVVTLQKNCIDSWCGYSGILRNTRRVSKYETPGGKVYQCYFAKRQQICMPLYNKGRVVYNDRAWLSN